MPRLVFRDVRINNTLGQRRTSAQRLGRIIG